MFYMFWISPGSPWLPLAPGSPWAPPCSSWLPLAPLGSPLIRGSVAWLAARPAG